MRHASFYTLAAAGSLVMFAYTSEAAGSIRHRPDGVRRPTVDP